MRRSTSEHGWTYIASFFLGENLARFTEGVGVESRRGPLFYLPVVFSDSFPWSLCLFGAAGLWFADWRSRRAAAGPREDPPDRTTAPSGSARCCGSGSSASSAFFSLSAAKQDLYIFPDRAGGRGARRDCSSRVTRPAAGRRGPGRCARRRP